MISISYYLYSPLTLEILLVAFYFALIYGVLKYTDPLKADNSWIYYFIAIVLSIISVGEVNLTRILLQGGGILGTPYGLLPMYTLMLVLIFMFSTLFKLFDNLILRNLGEGIINTLTKYFVYLVGAIFVFAFVVSFMTGIPVITLVNQVLQIQNLQQLNQALNLTIWGIGVGVILTVIIEIIRLGKNILSEILGLFK